VARFAVKIPVTCCRFAPAHNRGLSSKESKMRTHLIGTAGSGKTTLAQQLAARVGTTHVELDRLYWKAPWTHHTTADFAEHYTPWLAQDRWLMDGEYPEINAQIWAKATTVIWLDYPLPLVMYRLVRRGLHHARAKCNLWDSGSRETLPHLLSRRSIVWRALRSHGRRRMIYTRVMAQPRFAHIQFLRFVAPQETANWLQSI
jgi:adenylate kinase family enzyme